MSVKSCEKLDKSKVALTIEADAAAFEAAINKAYLQQRSKISVPGFRPGKAPRKMIESMYGAEVFYEEAVNIVLPDAYEGAVKEQELQVVGYPRWSWIPAARRASCSSAPSPSIPRSNSASTRALRPPRPRSRSWPRTSTPA